MLSDGMDSGPAWLPRKPKSGGDATLFQCLPQSDQQRLARHELFGVDVLLVGGRSLPVVAQGLQTLAAPLIILLMIILHNRESIMGDYRPTPAMNVMLVVIFAFSLLMAGIGVVGLMGL